MNLDNQFARVIQSKKFRGLGTPQVGGVEGKAPDELGSLGGWNTPNTIFFLILEQKFFLLQFSQRLDQNKFQKIVIEKKFLKNQKFFSLTYDSKFFFHFLRNICRPILRRESERGGKGVGLHDILQATGMTQIFITIIKHGKE